MEHKTKIIKLTDEVLDLSRQAFKDKLLGVRKQGFDRIGIDLSERPTLDSEAIGVLAYNYVILKDLGADLYFLNPSPTVYKILETTHLDKLIRIEFDKEPGKP